MPPKSARITVRLQPRASRDEVLGWQGANDVEVLRVRVKAPPVDGAANAALIQLLAKHLGVAKRDISLISGATARNKIIEVDGVSAEELSRRLSLA